MPDIDDGGFARRETSDNQCTSPYFECIVKKESCEDMDKSDCEACGCVQCAAYLEWLDQEKAESDELGDCENCGEPLDKDCNGQPRCPDCDGPCLCCYDGG